jgi:hypothetical protein
MDAPLETIRGKSNGVLSDLMIDPDDLAATKGTVTLLVDSLRTYTFNDPDKDGTQTEHLHNWMEVGKDVKPEMRGKFNHGVFSIDKVLTVSAKKFSEVLPTKDPLGQGRKVTMTAEGTLLLHGISSKKPSRSSSGSTRQRPKVLPRAYSSFVPENPSRSRSRNTTSSRAMPVEPS